MWCPWNSREIKRSGIMQPFRLSCIMVIEEGRVGETNRIEASASIIGTRLGTSQISATNHRDNSGSLEN